MKKSYFQLYANVIIVDGFTKSILLDLQYKKVYNINHYDSLILKKLSDNPIEQLIKLYEQKERDYIEEIIKMFLKLKLGFLTNSPKRYPRLDTSWNYSGHITNAIIDINI